jgi:anthranilate 1,2-dioxygenase large subunit
VAGEGATRVPFWIYTDPEVYAREMEVFFYGPSWNYVALDCEVPEPGRSSAAGSASAR